MLGKIPESFYENDIASGFDPAASGSESIDISREIVSEVAL